MSDNHLNQSAPRNVLGTSLLPCSHDPKTGFFRDGHCSCSNQDRGLHIICAVMTDEFLSYSQSMGNDLITPAPQFNFPGLKAGDQWCLCGLRWKEAHDAGCAPQVVAQATHLKMLDIISLDELEPYFISE